MTQKFMKMSKIDFNKLIKDIITAARGEATADVTKVNPLEEDSKLSITLKLEVTIAKDPARIYQGDQKRSRKLVLLTIDDRE